MRNGVRHRLCRSLSVSLGVLILSAAMPLTALSIEGDKTSTGLMGVRHVLQAALSVDENSPYTKPKDGKLPTNLQVSVRISDHAPDADFFGGVVVDFAEASFGKSGAERTIWQAGKCHRNRGLPKVTVTGIEGVIVDRDTRISVAAVPRHIGKLMPADEIIVTKPIARSFGDLLTGWALRAQTKVTRLVLDLRLITIHCGL